MKIYGEIVFDKGMWSIECLPHVMTRLKRIFWSIGPQFGEVRLKDTEDVCRDLAWFLKRYPMEISDVDVKHLNNRAEAHDKRIESFDLLLRGDIEPRIFELELPPRKYQAVATDLFLRSRGLLVVDDLGLGKTVIGISALTDPELRPALVVVPTHLQSQWRDEFQKFLPSAKVHILKKRTPYDVTKTKRQRRKKKEESQTELFSDENSFPDVLISTYHKMSGWAETLAPKIRSIIFDECQELRRTESLKASAARYLRANVDYCLGLSATPIYNYGGEFFNVLDVISPDTLGTKQEFINEWCRGSYGIGDKISISDPVTFGSYLRDSGLMLRRTRRDVGRELPAVSRIPHVVDSDTKALDDIEDSVSELAKIILDQIGNPLKRGQASRELDWRLRQATGIAKAPYVADFVKLLLESNEKVVLFGWHREVYSIWQSKLKNYNPALYTGTESPLQKERAKQAFISGDTDILIMSLRSGSGVDGLQSVCRNVVFGELDWSFGVHEQGIGRVNRDGQEDFVMAYFLHSLSGSDPVVLSALNLKKGQLEGVRDPDSPLIEKLQVDPEHIKNLAKHYLDRRSK